MNQVNAAQILLQFNTRKASTRLAQSIKSLMGDISEGVRIPEEPDHFYRDYASGHYPDESVSAFTAGEYAATKAHVDRIYSNSVQAINAQIDRVLPTSQVGALRQQLSKIWGQDVGIKVVGSRMEFREGAINMHLQRVDHQSVKVTGFSTKELG